MREHLPMPLYQAEYKSDVRASHTVRDLELAFEEIFLLQQGLKGFMQVGQVLREPGRPLSNNSSSSSESAPYSGLIIHSVIPNGLRGSRAGIGVTGGGNSSNADSPSEMVESRATRAVRIRPARLCRSLNRSIRAPMLFHSVSSTAAPPRSSIRFSMRILSLIEDQVSMVVQMAVRSWKDPRPRRNFCTMRVASSASRRLCTKSWRRKGRAWKKATND